MFDTSKRRHIAASNYYRSAATDIAYFRIEGELVRMSA